MSRSIGASLAAHLAGETQTVCYLWRVTRRDGQIFGFCSLDQDVIYDGVTYSAATGFTAAPAQHRIGLNVDGLELAGFLDSTSLTEADLAGGKWDHAAVRVVMVNYVDLSMGHVWISGGYFGEVKQTDGQFSVELRGLMSKLQHNVGRVLSPHCDAILGDTRCGATPTSDTQTVVSVTDRKAFTTDGTDAADTWNGGLATFLTGGNAGFSVEVLSSGTSGAVSLILSAPFDIAAGDSVTLTEGCDKTKATCSSKFDNVVNFRGWPHVPGSDRVLKPVAIL